VSGGLVRGDRADNDVSGGLGRPGGDPDLLEQLATQLEIAARGTGTLADSTCRVTTGIRVSARWDGAAADAYTAFTGNLTRGIGAAAPPLSRIAAAVRGYAGYLRTAQQQVAVYESAAQHARDSGNSAACVAAADAAAHDAVAAVMAQQTAGDQAAAQVRGAGADLADVFGPDGPVRGWVERRHAPWDSLAGGELAGEPAPYPEPYRYIREATRRRSRRRGVAGDLGS
jgi:hypothetical protein